MRYRIERPLSLLWSRSPPRRRVSFVLTASNALAWLAMPLANSVIIACSSGCAKREVSTQQNQNVSSPDFARGDRVVVEVRAAEFFEGRVVSATKSSVRVEPQDRSAPLAVSLADTYRLPPARAAFRIGQLAICLSERQWIGCRVESVEGTELRGVTVDGKQLQTASEAVVPVSAITELNIKQAFARARARQEFREAAERAGTPKAPPGARLLPKARVVARRGNAWYGGIVRELEDDSAQIEFSADSQRESLKSEDIVPEPPYPTAFARGDFALVRPDSPSQPWQAVRVVGTSDRQFRVVSIDGAERVVTVRDLLPLSGK